MRYFIKLLRFPSCSGRGYGYLGGRHRDKVPFHWTVKRLHTINMASILMSTLITRLKKCLSDVFMWNYPPSLLYCVLEGYHYVYHSKKLYNSCPWRIFDSFVLEICLFNHLVMDIYFILFIILAYLFILLLTCLSVGHWELFHLLLYPFNMPFVCVFKYLPLF